MSFKLQQNRFFDEEYRIVDQKVFDDTKWGTRHNQCLLLFITLTTAYSIRSCMGVALVAMVHYDGDHNLLPSANNSIINETVWTNSTEKTLSDEFENHGFLSALLLTPPYPQFPWTKNVQDSIISSFVWGYMALQVPGGQLVYRFGARYLLFTCFAINSVLSLMFPIATYYGGWIFAFICRMIQGLSQAFIYPSIHTILGKWTPLEERGRMSAIAYRGQALGTALGFPIAGFIGSSPLGWPGIFRFYGILSGIIAIILWFYLADSPAQHKRISVAERKYIEEALEQKEHKKKMVVPWKSILTSRGMIAIVVAHTGMAWVHLISYSQVPAYMDKVVGVNIKTNGLLTSLPFAIMFVTNFFFSWLADMMVVKKYLSVTNTRKLFNSLGSVPAAIGYFALGYAPKNIYVIEGILIIICGFKTADNLGFLINHIDIAPNFAGVMMSITNFISNGCASFAPTIAGLILTDVTDEHLWRKVFLIAGGLYFCTNLVYVVIGTAELAVWNDPTQYERVASNENILIQVEKDCIKDNTEDNDKNKKENILKLNKI